jgi:DNA-binding response OmpR family regulator
MPGRKTVLVVDDDQDFREALEGALGHEGYDVLTASSGSRGVALAMSRHPDVVLLDDLLPPGQRGVEVLAELRQKGYAGHVVMISGSPGLTSAPPGANHLLPKPVDYDALCRLLERLTSGASA